MHTINSQNAKRSMHSDWEGILLGLSTIIIIAFSRWLCIVGEYYFTKRFWIFFLVVGLLFIVCSLVLSDRLLSAIASVAGFCFLWGIGEVIQQEKRVAKGWFPVNPRRAHKVEMSNNK